MLYGREWTEDGRDSSGPFFSSAIPLGRTYHSRAGTAKSLRLNLRLRFISLVPVAALTNDAEVSYVNKRPEKLTGKSNRIAPKSEI
jgi:hypothetical protein